MYACLGRKFVLLNLNKSDLKLDEHFAEKILLFDGNIYWQLYYEWYRYRQGRSNEEYATQAVLGKIFGDFSLIALIVSCKADFKFSPKFST